MATFGGYETDRELHRSGLATMWAARPAGAQPDELAQHVVKVFRPLVAIEADETAAKVALFLDAVRVQREVAGSGSPRWAPILEAGPIEGGAFYVSTYYHRSLEQLIHGHVRLGHSALGTIVGSMVQGLTDLKTACGRPHGGLKPSNVLVDTEGDVARTRVVLCDPLPTSQVDQASGEAADVRAIGRLLYQLVMHKPFQIMGGWPVASSEEWRRLGGKGEAWRELCSSLLDPNAPPDTLTLESLAARVGALRKGRAVRALLALAMAAVVVAAVGVGAWLAYPHLIRTPPSNGGPRVWDSEAEAAWKQLCIENLYWFAKFQSDLTARRRKAWAGDATLAALLQKLGDATRKGVKLDPRSFSDEPDVGIEGLHDDPPDAAKKSEAIARTEEALAVVRDIKSTFHKSKWPKLEQLAELAGQWEQHGWLKPANYLFSLVFAIEPRRPNDEVDILVPDPQVAAKVDHLLAVHDKTLPAIEARWQEIERARKALESSGDPILKQFAELCPEEMKSQTGKGRAEDLQELQAGLDDAAKLTTSLARFVEGEWKTRVARDLFRKDSAAARTFDGKVTRHTIRVWRERVKDYYVLKPDEDPRGTQKDWDKRFAGVQAEVNKLAEFGDAARERASQYRARLATARKAVARLLERPAVRKNRDSLADEADSTRTTLDKLKEDVAQRVIVYMGDPSDWYRGVQAFEFKSSAVLNTEWQKRRGQLLAGIKPDQLKADSAAYRGLRPKVDTLRDALAQLEADEALPRGMPQQARKHGARPWYKAFTAEVSGRRERALQRALSLGSGQDAVPDLGGERFRASWQELCGDYRRWRDGVAAAAAALGTIEDGLDDLYLLDEEPHGAGKTLATLFGDLRRTPILQTPELTRVIEPVAGRIERLRRIAALSDRQALAQTALGAPEREVALAAWRRLGSLDKPPWPDTTDELKQDGEIRSRLASELRTIRHLARRKALQDALAAESRHRLHRWLSVENQRLLRAIDTQRDVIIREAAGDTILARFGAFVQAELAAGGQDDPQARLRALTEVGRLADRLATFVQGDWKANVNREQFIRSSSVHRNFKEPVTRETLLAWLEEVKDFYHEKPEQFIPRIKALSSVSRSAAVNREWVKRRDLLLLIYPSALLQADRKLYSTVRRRFQELQAFVGGLDDPKALPAGLTEEAKRLFGGGPQAILERLVGDRREQALARMVAKIPWGEDGFPAVTLTQFRQRDEWKAACKQYADFRGDMQSIVPRTQALASLLDAGYLLDDKPPKAIKTLGELYKDWKAFAAAAFMNSDLRDALKDIEARVDTLLALEHLDRSQLVARAQALKPDDPPQAAMILWLRLGKAPDWPTGLHELKVELALRNALLASARGLGARNPHPVRWVQPELASEGTRRWEVCFNALVPRQAPTDADEKSLAEAIGIAPQLGVARGRLAPATQCRWLLHALRKAIFAMSEKAKKDAVAAAVTAFRTQVGALPGGLANQPAVAGLLKRLHELAAQQEDDAPGGGLDRAGPAAFQHGGGWRASPAADGKSAAYAWADKHTLHFVRVEPAGGQGKPSYLCTTEVSLGLFIDVVTAAGKWAEVIGLLRGYDLNFPDPRKGPRVWELTRDRAPIRTTQRDMDTEWLVPLAGLDYYPAGLDPGRPSLEHPMQYVSPEAALYVARLLGGRLPTSAEWQAAFAASAPFAPFAKGQPANLRDATWKQQQDHIRQLRQAGTRADWPDAGIFLPNNGAALPTGGTATVATAANDKTLWLTPVGSGPTFRHLVGNVAELVHDEPGRFEGAFKDIGKLSADALTAFLDEAAGPLKVIGGSALSPPELWNGSMGKPFGHAYAVDLAVAREGYADVGFRLAFSAPQESVLARVQRLLKTQGYVPALR